MTYNVDNIRKPDIVPHLFGPWLGDWDDLNDDEQKAWGVVGYTMTTWNNDTLTIKPFEDYTDNQKKAINDLGFKDYMWDDYPVNISYPYTLEEWNDDGSDATVTNIDDYYEEHDWADLTKYQQELFETLGDKECNWEEDGSCDDINIPWKDLTIAQKTAAMYLGFDEESWAIWVGTTGHDDGHGDDNTDNKDDGHGDDKDDGHGNDHEHDKHRIITAPVSRKLIFILTLLKIPFTTEPKENKVVINTDKEILDLLKKFF